MPKIVKIVVIFGITVFLIAFLLNFNELNQKEKMTELILRDNIISINDFVARNKFPPQDLSTEGIDGVGNLDAWGNGMFYKKCGDIEYIIYSFGENGVDERGHGDDVTTPSGKGNVLSCRK